MKRLNKAQEAIDDLKVAGAISASEEVAARGRARSQEMADHAVNLVHRERGQAYGHPKDDFTRIAMMWNGILHGKLKQPITPEDIPLCMMALKMSREVNRHKDDNLTDIIGYILTLNRLSE
jgi:hypothetical protein